MFFIDDYRRRSGAGQGKCIMVIGVGFHFDIR
jgi:hypothetical protein